MAAPTSITDSASVPVQTVKVGAPASFTHDLTDHGYLAGSGAITSASLLIVLTDDNGNEDYTISLGSVAPQVWSYSDNVGFVSNYALDVSGQPLVDLIATGMLNVTISATNCTGNRCGSYAFKIVSSTLTAYTAPALSAAAPAPNTVPEPGTLAMVGLGVAGVGALRRRRLRA